MTSKLINGDMRNFSPLFFLDQFLIGHQGFIAGGCFKNIFAKQKIKDVDVYFQSSSDFEEAKKYYRDEIKKENSQYRKSYENSKVWAVLDLKTGIRIELIKSLFGSPETVISQFDFSITKFAYFRDYANADEDDWYAQFTILYHEYYFEHLHTKRLVIDDDIPFPVSTFNRSYKYNKYGFGLCKESKIKLLTAIRDLPDLDDAALGASLYDGLD